MKIAITAETTIDLPKEMLSEFDIRTIPFHIALGEQDVADGEVLPEAMFEYTEKTGTLPRTSAVNEFQYDEFFASIRTEYDAVVHFSLSSDMSSACANAKRSAEKQSNVFVVDTRSLSTGIALQAIYARKLANAGKTPEEIVELVSKRIDADQASFSLESVEYLYKGGRCSRLAFLGANLLRLKPEIYVKGGKMGPGKKYRGSMMKVVMNYVEDTLEEFHSIDPSLVFITYSTAPEEVVGAVKERLEKAGFQDIRLTRAGGTIASHCGPHCLGILYFNDGPHPIESKK